MEIYADLLNISVTLNSSDEGRTAQFIATASGVSEANFVYQWRKRDNERLPNKVSGVNKAALIIPDLSMSDNGDYYCIVTNEWSRSVESNYVTLIINGMYSYSVSHITK